MVAQAESMVLPPRLPLVVTLGNRNRTTTKDARLINCYIEKDDQTDEIMLFGRPGLTVYSTSPPGVGQGMYNWQGDLYFILNGTLYKNGITLPGSLDQTGGAYRFSPTLGANPKLMFANGIKAYATNGTIISADLHSIDPDYPLVTVKGIVYLNGATYVMDPQGQIWGSVINSVDQPGDWSAVNFIAAQAEPDGGVALAKQLNYVIALGQWSLEVFADVGNATGSPLQAVQGSYKKIGCANADSVREIDDRLFWISATRSAGVQVSSLDQLNHDVISDDYIDRIVQSSNLTQVISSQLKIDGHSFYILTLKDINTTLVYDITTKVWHVWTDKDGNYFPISDYSFTSSPRRHVFQHESNGKVYLADTTYYNDEGFAIKKDIYTPKFDANTTRGKLLSLMRFVGNEEAGSTLWVRWSDDDYKTWSNFRKVDLSQPMPELDDLGTFVRRAFHFQHRSNTPFWLAAVDMQYDLCTL